MKFTCSKKRYSILIEPETPEVRNSAGQLTQIFMPPIYANFEEGERGKGWLDTDEPHHPWNQPESKKVIKGLKNSELKERVEYIIKHSKGWDAGWVKEWTKPKKFKLVEVKDGTEEGDFVVHQDAVVPSDEMLEADAKKMIDSINK